MDEKTEAPPEWPTPPDGFNGFAPINGTTELALELREALRLAVALALRDVLRREETVLDPCAAVAQKAEQLFFGDGSGPMGETPGLRVQLDNYLHYGEMGRGIVCFLEESPTGHSAVLMLTPENALDVNLVCRDDSHEKTENGHPTHH